MSRVEEMGIFDEEEIFENDNEVSSVRSRSFPGRTLFTLFIGLAITFVGLRNFYLNYALTSRINRIREECASYQDVEKKLVELKRKRALVRSMITRIKTLQKNKKRTIEFYEALNTLVPDGLVISAVKKEKSRITIKGYAADANVYSSFIQALNFSGFFREKIEETRNSRGEFFIAGTFDRGKK